VRHLIIFSGWTNFRNLLANLLIKKSLTKKLKNNFNPFLTTKYWQKQARIVPAPQPPEPPIPWQIISNKKPAL
jgi:hypothetical protein